MAVQPEARARWLRDDVGSKAWVAVAKGLAIVLVVLYHTLIFFDSVGVTGLPGRLKVVLELFPMPIFFVLAGLFSPRMLSWTFPELWRRKLLPIVYLYLVWSLFRFAFFFAFPALNAHLGTEASRDPMVLLGIVTGPANLYWFLYALVIFTLAAWLLRRVPALVQIIPAAVLSTAVTAGWISSGTVVWDRVGALWVFFLIGVHYAKPAFDLVARAGAGLFWAATGAFLAVSLALYVPFVSRLPFVVTIAQLLAVFVAAVASKHLARVRGLGILTDLGNQSLQIYVLHIYIVAALTSALALFVAPDWPPPVDSLVLLTGVILVFVITLAIIRATSRWKWLYIPPTSWLRSRPVASASKRPISE